MWIVEDYSLHTYPFTIMVSTTTTQILANNILDFNKRTFWKKSLDELDQAVVDYKSEAMQTTGFHRCFPKNLFKSLV